MMMTKPDVFLLIRRFGPATVVLAAALAGSVLYHRQLAEWFGLDSNAIFGASRTVAMAPGPELPHDTAPPPGDMSSPINDVCPVLGNAVSANTESVMWKGYAIGFCCAGCDTKWNAWPDEQKQAFVDRFVKTDDAPKTAAGNLKPINRVCPILGNEIPEDAATIMWHGQAIGFCCPPCEDDWNELPDEKKQAFVDSAMIDGGPALQPKQTLTAKPKEASMLPVEGIAHWTCSMHPSVKSKDPGTCPICKMDLTPVTNEELRSGVIFVDAQRRQLIGVRTAAVLEHDLVKTIRAVGIVAYDETQLTDVTLKFRGWIGEMYADYTGKHVTKDEPLFTVYSPELLSAQQEYLDARAAQKIPGRSTQVAQSARERLLLWDIAQQQLDELVERGKPLQYVPILSPATGTIIHKMAVEGSAIDAGKMIYRIADLSTLWIEAELYENEIPHIRVGQRVDMAISYLPGKKFEGRLSYVYPYLDSKSRRVRVRVAVSNEAGLLKPNMYADMYIKVPLGRSLAVPEEAILYAGESNIVFLDLGEGRMRAQRIKLGVRATDPALGVDLVEVLDGLHLDDVVVTSGNFLIASESKLKSGIDKW